MSARKNNTPGDTSDREIVTTRVFDAPRQMVFEAWADRETIGLWWGPRGFSTTTHERNVAVGGVWRFIMHGPDGTDYKNRIDYLEVVKGEKLVYRHGDDGGGFSFHNTVTFADEDGKTRVTMRAVFSSPEERDGVVKFGAVEGGKQTLERLGEHLANLGAPHKPFVISREFDAPRALVYKVWTEREHLERWWGPKGVTIDNCRNDLRRGGMMHYRMTTPDGNALWGKWVYLDLIPPQRIVFVNSFSDESGGTTRPPMIATWPLEMRTTVSFTERNGRTTVTIHFVPLNPTPVEKKTFDDNHDSMSGGWGGTFDRLRDYLSDPNLKR